MSTQMQALPVRVSAALRALVDRAGPVNAASRALLILGAHAAGYALGDLRHEIAALLLRGELETAVRDALIAASGLAAGEGASGVTSTRWGARSGAGGDARSGDDAGDGSGVSTAASTCAITRARTPAGGWSGAVAERGAPDGAAAPELDDPLACVGIAV